LPKPAGSVTPNRPAAAGDPAIFQSTGFAAAVAAGDLVVPIAATFPVEQTRAAVELQRAGHVHGKVVILLDRG
jgi:hypothetical protein